MEYTKIRQGTWRLQRSKPFESLFNNVRYVQIFYSPQDLERYLQTRKFSGNFVTIDTTLEVSVAYMFRRKKSNNSCSALSQLKTSVCHCF